MSALERFAASARPAPSSEPLPLSPGDPMAHSGCPLRSQELSGTTAVAVLYQFTEPGKAKVWAACAGDSRAVMQHKGGKVTDLTEDQKPNTPAEQARITKCGGYVSPPEEEWGGPARTEPHTSTTTRTHNASGSTPT